MITTGKSRQVTSSTVETLERLVVILEKQIAVLHHDGRGIVEHSHRWVVLAITSELPSQHRLPIRASRLRGRRGHRRAGPS